MIPVTANSRIKPPALRKGDKVGIVAPASNLKRDLLQRGCDALRAAGYEPFYFESILDRDIYFAGSARRRAQELETMFEREDIRAVACARGGYGSNHLLRELDLRKIAAHPKIFVGYSDLTTLMTWFTGSANLITFHGPMVAKDFAIADGVDFSSWQNATGGASSWEAVNSGAKPLIAGQAEGELYGGCLSLLVAALGTAYDIHTDGTILFLEDINAKPYQVDRMLMQLKLAGKLDHVRGIIFGEMIDCEAVSQDYSLEQVIMRVVEDFKVPVAYGFRSGHVSSGNITLPFGVRARLEVNDDVKLTMLEAATAQ